MGRPIAGSAWSEKSKAPPRLGRAESEQLDVRSTARLTANHAYTPPIAIHRRLPDLLLLEEWIDLQMEILRRDIHVPSHRILTGVVRGDPGSLRRDGEIRRSELLGGAVCVRDGRGN